MGSAIAAQVVSQDLEIFELSRNRASLEDVFINLTMQEPQAGADGLIDGGNADLLEDEEAGEQEAEALLSETASVEVALPEPPDQAAT